MRYCASHEAQLKAGSRSSLASRWVFMLTSRNLSSVPHIRHGFFGRRGGVSDGIYSSLNCGQGSGDDLEKVRENRFRVSEALGTKATLSTCYQIHSPNVITLRMPWEKSEEADALVTDQPNVPIGILTADCLPVLFADRKKPIIGAAHAGWKGAIGGVLEATIEAMKTLGATEITAAIGPAIQQKSYEVGPEFYDRFLQESQENTQFFIPSTKDGHHMFDLPGYAKSRLLRAGIANPEVLDYDTCSLENDFFSFRRTTLRGEKAYGRQVAAIVLE